MASFLLEIRGLCRKARYKDYICTWQQTILLKLNINFDVISIMSLSVRFDDHIHKVNPVILIMVARIALVKH